MNTKIISKINRYKDYLKFDNHRKIRLEIANIKNELDQYDYGEGYFYQSLSKINLSGLRNTQIRKDFLNLSKFTKNNMENELPLVSVLMNCYNGETHLSEAIDSVFDQTYTNCKIVFWDN